MIKDYLQNAIAGIEQEKANEIERVKAEIMQSKIIPYNVDVDNSRDKAINQLTEKLNQDTEALKAKYNAERQAIIDASEKSKSDNLNAVLATETYPITSKYDKVISDLRKQIDEE